MEENKTVEGKISEFLTVYVQVEETGQIRSWSSEESYGTAIAVDSEDFQTFNETSGQKFKVIDGRAVYQEDLPLVNASPPIDQITALELAITELYERMVK